MVGIAVDGNTEGDIMLFKQVGKVAALRTKIDAQTDLDTAKRFVSHTGMAHTRWATHGMSLFLLGCLTVSLSTIF